MDNPSGEQLIKPDTDNEAKPASSDDIKSSVVPDKQNVGNNAHNDESSNPNWFKSGEHESDDDQRNHYERDIADIPEVSWSASEFIANKKSIGWYAILTVCTIAAAAIVFLLTKDKISTGVIVIVAIIFGVFASNQPRVLKYKLDGNGLTVGDKFYSYDQFKSFGVLDEGNFSSIVLVPLKRFMTPRSIYYDPNDEDKIINVLAERLPLEDHKHDTVDSLMKRIRF